MKAKRFVSAVSALAITASVMSTCVSVSAAGENVILKGQQIESKAGAEFSLDINLAELSGEAIQGFSGCEFAIEYDPAKISIDSIVEGATLKTGATDAELDKAPGIGDEVTMVNKGNYNCFDYNIVERSGKNVIAVLWCTGLDSSKYWASKEGTMLTLNGTVYADAKEGEEIPVNVVAIDRDGNKDIVFGYVDGGIDKVYSAAVAEQGLIKIVKDSVDQPDPEKGYDDYTPLWGDVNDNGAVTASDLVAMVKFMIDPEVADLTNQGKVNGNLDQSDKNKDLTSDTILGARDLVYLEKYLLEDITAENFPYVK
jgi:hypothetical protein